MVNLLCFHGARCTAILLVALASFGGAWAQGNVSESDALAQEAVAESPVQGVEPAQESKVIAKGLASWYGGQFHGRRTASGEIYDKNALTAAHKTLPFGTLVRVKSVRTGKVVVVRINDRGPFTPKRVIDLSAAAASVLGIKGRGLAPVNLFLE